MSVRRPLRGSCGCGRNNYIIALPENAADSAHVFLDSSSENRRAQAAPLTAWLHIPLTWFQSHTTSFFPDETHSMIRKTFTPTREPFSRRNFCGFCGTHLTYWNDRSEDEAEYLNVTVGSLFGEDLRTLGEMGLLRHDVDDYDVAKDDPEQQPTRSDLDIIRAATGDGEVARRTKRGVEGDMTWMEELIDRSRLGRSHQTKRGAGRSNDGTIRVEWEITELVDDGSETEQGAGRGKRKLGDSAPGGDAQMQL